MAYDPIELRVYRGVTKTAAILIALPFLLITAFLFWAYLGSYERVRALAPRQFGIGTLYSGDLNDPLGMAQFSISSDAAHRLETDPQTFLAGLPEGSEWKPTPVKVETLQLGGDCGNALWCMDNQAHRNAVQWLNRPGSYYRRWGDSDAFILVVNPREEQLVLGYYYS